MKSKRQAGRVSTPVVVGLVLVVFVVGCVTILMFGRVSGVEFSAQKFSARSFHYLQIPLLGIQIWPASLSSDKSDLAKYVRKNRWASNVAGHPERWDIASMNRFRGDASILTNYLDQRDAKGIDSWETWSQKNQLLAAEFWPVIARMAHEQMYGVIPDLFECARRCTTKDELVGQLQRVIAAEAAKQANAEQASGNTERGKQLVAVGLSYVPDDPTLLKTQTELQ